MAKTRESVHGLEPGIDLVLADNASAPLDQMVFENTLVKLMKYIRCYSCKYVAVWEFAPKWLIHGDMRTFPPYQRLLKTSPTSSYSRPLERIQGLARLTLLGHLSGLG